MSDPAAASPAAETTQDAAASAPAASATPTPPPPPPPSSDTAAASVSELSVASSDGDASGAAQRAMSYEEFRRFYVATRQANYTSTGGSGNVNQTSTRADSSTAPVQGSTSGQPAGAAAGTVRRRVHGLFDHNVGDGMGAPAGPPPAAAAAAPPPPPVAVPGPLSRVAAVAGAAVHWMARGFMRNRGHFIQLFLVLAVLYTQRGLSAGYLVGLLGLYLVVTVVQVVIRNFEVAHETGVAAAPSFLGRLFKPEGHTGPVSAPRRVGYVVAKCLEAFVLSLFPMYSVERLERELGADGIVR